jgi:glycosyltransferase involved in cell wall biosynthesis
MPNAATGRPDISFVMPCYNEEEIVGYTATKLLAAFRAAGYRLELITVDNGSSDRTGEILKAMEARNNSVVYCRVDKNEGYGNGLLAGIPLCTAPWIGLIPADGQVDAEDVVRLYEAAAASNGRIVAKVRRRFRMDGLARKVVSVSYNILVRALWPSLGSIDVNGTPKILPRHVLLGMQLRSKDWFLDPEIMIKAHALGLRTLEFNAFARMRGNGISHVRMGTCWEFLLNLFKYRFSRGWRQDLKYQSIEHEEGESCVTSSHGRLGQEP